MRLYKPATLEADSTQSQPTNTINEVLGATDGEDVEEKLGEGLAGGFEKAIQAEGYASIGGGQLRRINSLQGAEATSGSQMVGGQEVFVFEFGAAVFWNFKRYLKIAFL